MTLNTRATIEDLYLEPRKAELINGEIVRMSPTGQWPGYAADEIYSALRQYAKRTGKGRAFADNKAFVVNLPNRESFSPDAAYRVGKSSKMKFISGAPQFAAEVRSQGDRGPAAEVAMAEKRRDYFAAGTLVVWDVNLQGKDVVRVFRASDPLNPKIYRRGEIAEAEPAVPEWTMPVDDLFEPDDENA